MSGLKHLISFDEATSRAKNARWKGLSVVEVEVEHSLDMIIAEDIISRVDLPPYHRSAVDGYAVRHRDISGASSSTPVQLRVTGRSDFEVTSAVDTGECSEINTGGRLPPGADSVIMSEYATRSDDSVFVEKDSRIWENVSKRGEDISAGSKIIGRGDLIRSWHISAMIAVGLTRIKVFGRIRLGVMATGNEIVSPSRSGVRNTTQPLLLNYFRRGYMDTVDCGVYPDDLEEISQGIEGALEGVDVLVVTGGSSIGDFDYTAEALEKLGTEIFRGALIKPGRTISMYGINGKPVYSVSGLPVAALTSFEAFFVRFMIDVLEISDSRQTIRAKLTERLINNGGMRSFVRIMLSRTTDSLDATPLRHTGSGMLSSLFMSNGITVVPESVEGMEKGEYVWVTLTGGAS